MCEVGEVSLTFLDLFAQGGGIYTETHGVITIIDTRIITNHAGDYGGGIVLKTYLLIAFLKS